MRCPVFNIDPLITEDQLQRLRMAILIAERELCNSATVESALLEHFSRENFALSVLFIDRNNVKFSFTIAHFNGRTSYLDYTKQAVAV